MTEQTIFSIQSCTKMYTATAVLLAVQQGLVALDEPIIVGEYVGRGGDLVWISRTDTGLRLSASGRGGRLRVVGPDQVMVETGSRFRLRLLPDKLGDPAYLQSVEDGFVWYRNDVSAGSPAPGSGPEPWEGDYAVAAADGTDIVRLRLRRDAVVVRNGTDLELGLEQHLPEIYFTADGEALDLTRTPPTFQNVKLWPR